MAPVRQRFEEAEHRQGCFPPIPIPLPALLRLVGVHRVDDNSHYFRLRAFLPWRLEHGRLHLSM